MIIKINDTIFENAKHILSIWGTQIGFKNWDTAQRFLNDCLTFGTNPEEPISIMDVKDVDSHFQFIGKLHQMATEKHAQGLRNEERTVRCISNIGHMDLEPNKIYPALKIKENGDTLIRDESGNYTWYGSDALEEVTHDRTMILTIPDIFYEYGDPYLTGYFDGKKQGLAYYLSPEQQEERKDITGVDSEVKIVGLLGPYIAGSYFPYQSRELELVSVDIEKRTVSVQLKRASVSIKDFVKKQHNFMQAAKELSIAWEHLGEPNMTFMNADYPFDWSFDEVLEKIAQWAETTAHKAELER